MGEDMTGGCERGNLIVMRVVRNFDTKNGYHGHNYCSKHGCQYLHSQTQRNILRHKEMG